ncbi:MAG: S8 family peptidase [Firmicutes bacterium]|nr:S8 family peptidase [Bacillota bacterium]MDH7494506.1 S8 family peptidase [Bacillota bacterium]
MVRKIVLFRPGVEPEKVRSLVEECGGRLKKRLPIVNGAACVFPEEATAMSLLSRSGEVAWVEDDFVVSVTSACLFGPGPRPKPRQQVVPWGITKVRAPEAWSRATGRGVRVAVLDTGIDADHPDLKPNVDGGFDCINETTTIADDNGHGTHVAGTIAALDNDIGVVGVAPEARLYSVKAFDSRGQGQVSDIVQGVEWCITNRMQVINMSFGTPDSSKALTIAIEQAARAGIVMVAAAGNDGKRDHVLYPARDPNVIAVAASTRDDRVASFSNSGEQVAVAAPGEDIFSTHRDGGYKTLAGTSMACPHVAGIAALILSASPGLDRDAVRDILCKTATRLPGFAPDQQGSGIVNALEAVARVRLSP